MNGEFTSPGENEKNNLAEREKSWAKFREVCLRKVQENLDKVKKPSDNETSILYLLPNEGQDFEQISIEVNLLKDATPESSEELYGDWDYIVDLSYGDEKEGSAQDVLYIYRRDKKEVVKQVYIREPNPHPFMSKEWIKQVLEDHEKGINSKMSRKLAEQMGEFSKPATATEINNLVELINNSEVMDE